MSRESFYFLGYIATLLFGLRFLYQWYVSEKKKQSFVPPTFWTICLAANLCMALHAFIQLQYPIVIIQVANASLAFRNIALLRNKSSPIPKVLLQIVCMLFCATLLYFSQSFFSDFSWMRSPKKIELPLLWHLFGMVGIFLFGVRFWIQWFFAEKAKKSFISRPFWFISCAGALLSLVYFIKLQDRANILSFGLGLIPYLRNLMLSRKQVWNLAKDQLFMVAGEKSGDLLGQELVPALKKENPLFKFQGVGGNLMRKAGVAICYPLEKLSVMGITDVLLALPRLFLARKQIEKSIFQSQPEAIILIDYQDFNMHLAKRLRKKGYPGKIIHYVSPSVWAWRKNRVYQLAKTHDLLLCIFPFEKKYYEKTSLKVVYVGHPLTAISPLNDSSHSLLALFPGSRVHEIERNLPLQLHVAKEWLAKNPTFSLAISVASQQVEEKIKAHLLKEQVNASLFTFEKRYQLMQKAALAIATSGTVNLELALHRVPTLVTYKLGALNYFLGRYVFSIILPHYSIVNIVGGTTIYPEFVHRKLSKSEICNSLAQLFETREEVRKKLLEVRVKLGDQEAALKAAQAIVEAVQNRC